MIRRCTAITALILSAACYSPVSEPADSTPDFTGTWGHQRVFGIDEVCSEVLPGGSVRNVECPERATPPAGDAGSDFPNYRPEFASKVAALRDQQVEMDTVLRCYPPGVPRIGPPAKIVQNEREVVFLYDDANGSFFRIIPVDGRPPRTGVVQLPGRSGGTFRGRYPGRRNGELHRRNLAD